MKIEKPILGLDSGTIKIIQSVSKFLEMSMVPILIHLNT